ncbi:uncharacterized protein N7482_001572 [Penicillium canariense]|uniref:Uncharacterized protein n=1 Tax=Penicillium canariense TaxID=189055 RepID=A0A9W9IEF6_9EURO|nr:uncharacterized protein N7482_001572 [Penicillium canariense]KAJ5175695.1 hypothetical protein N7482_001572 [Penicillium canariense]
MDPSFSDWDSLAQLLTYHLDNHDNRAIEYLSTKLQDCGISVELAVPSTDPGGRDARLIFSRAEARSGCAVDGERVFEFPPSHANETDVASLWNTCNQLGALAPAVDIESGRGYGEIELAAELCYSNQNDSSVRQEPLFEGMDTSTIGIDPLVLESTLQGIEYDWDGVLWRDNDLTPSQSPSLLIRDLSSNTSHATPASTPCSSASSSLIDESMTTRCGTPLEPEPDTQGPKQTEMARKARTASSKIAKSTRRSGKTVTQIFRKPQTKQNRTERLTDAQCSPVSMPIDSSYAAEPGELTRLTHRYGKGSAYNLSEAVLLETYDMSINALRSDLVPFLEERLERWKQEGFWFQGRLPKPSLKGTARKQLYSAYSCICKLDTHMADDQIRNRVAMVMLHTSYNLACQEWKMSGSQKPKGKGRGDTSSVIDDILEDMHSDWDENDRKKHLRSRFHDKKRFGKRWLVLGDAVGMGILIACSPKIASIV